MVELNCDYKRLTDKGSMVICLKIPKAYEQDILFLTQNKRVEKTSQLHVRIAVPRKPRSTGKDSQNHRLNGFIQQLCMFTGDDFDAMKMEVKRRAIKRGYPFKTALGGGPVPQSEADSSMVECAMLIDEVEAVAAFLNFTLREE